MFDGNSQEPNFSLLEAARAIALLNSWVSVLIKQVCDAWESDFTSLKAYQYASSKFPHKPKIPRQCALMSFHLCYIFGMEKLGKVPMCILSTGTLPLMLIKNSSAQIIENNNCAEKGSQKLIALAVTVGNGI